VVDGQLRGRVRARAVPREARLRVTFTPDTHAPGRQVTRVLEPGRPLMINGIRFTWNLGRRESSGR
jgi:hypothetical protein